MQLVKEAIYHTLKTNLEQQQQLHQQQLQQQLQSPHSPKSSIALYLY